MIKQHQLCATRGPVDKDVTRVRVTVHITLHKDHLTVELPQLPGHLHRQVHLTLTATVNQVRAFLVDWTPAQTGSLDTHCNC